MTLLFLELLALQVVLPLALLGWLAAGRERSRAGWMFKALLSAAYLVAVTLAGLWMILPWYVPFVYLLLFALAAVWSVRHSLGWPAWPTGKGWIGVGLRGVLALAFTAIALYAIAGRRPPPGEIVSLALPLRDGTYYVANGGSNSLVNPHIETLTLERARNYRGQSYGVDLVKLDAGGFRASGILPRNPASYAIFGDPVHAPCEGRILRAEGRHRDLPPPEADQVNRTGNHVFLECGAVHVLLAHLRQGSVRVQVGDRVEEGWVVGEVGNSGNTGEPHLHIHAQRPARGDAYLGGDPIPIRLDGRFRVRNDRVTRFGADIGPARAAAPESKLAGAAGSTPFFQR